MTFIKKYLTILVKGGIYSKLKCWWMCLRGLICAQGVILMNSKHITNYKPKDFAELLGVRNIVKAGTREYIKENWF